MRKKLLFVFGLVLFLGLSLFLADQVQAKEIASFKGDNLGQIEVAVLREGAPGGWPVVVDDHLKVTGFFYPEQGIVTGNSGGDPVVFGDHVRVDGYLFVNQGIVKGVSGGDPVIIGDHLRVDGVISRPFGSVEINDDLKVTGNATVAGDLTVNNVIRADDIKAEESLTAARDLLVYGEIVNPRGPVKIGTDEELDVSDGRLIIPSGTSTPTECQVGELFLKTDTTTLYGCTAVDTWTAL